MRPCVLPKTLKRTPEDLERTQYAGSAIFPNCGMLSWTEENQVDAYLSLLLPLEENIGSYYTWEPLNTILPLVENGLQNWDLSRNPYWTASYRYCTQDRWYEKGPGTTRRKIQQGRETAPRKLVTKNKIILVPIYKQGMLYVGEMGRNLWIKSNKLVKTSMIPYITLLILDTISYAEIAKGRNRKYRSASSKPPTRSTHPNRKTSTTHLAKTASSIAHEKLKSTEFCGITSLRSEQDWLRKFIRLEKSRILGD